jgi:hypothetical protein
MSGDAKGNKHYYEKNGKKFILPGFNIVYNICALTCNKTLEDIYELGEEQEVMVYNFTAKAEVAIKAHVLTELIGKIVCLGIQEIVENKREQGSDGGYYPTNEKTSKNEAKHVFQNGTMFSFPELKRKEEKAETYEKWIKSNKDKVRSNFKKISQSEIEENFGSNGENNQPEHGGLF